MILIGTMDWASTKLRGMFRCPECGTNQRFRLRASRPFLTLYFIPVIPLGGMQEFVQCEQCKNSFETVVLTGIAEDVPEAVQQPVQAATFEEDLVRVMALIMVEDGHVTDGEISAALTVYEKMTELVLSREELGQVCSQVRLHRWSPTSYLATAKDRRHHDEKLLLVQAMFAVASADGQVTSGRMESLIKSQQILGLEEREFQSAISATEQWLV